MAYCELKANRECKERKYAASLHVVLQKKYVAKAKCKNEDSECTLELGGEEHEENANMVLTNIEIKVEKKFPAGIYVVKEIEGDNDDVLKKKSFSACSKDRCKYEKRTGNKEIELANPEIAVYEDIVFWPRTCSGKLVVDLVRLGLKMFQNKSELFAPTVRPGKE